MISQEIILFLTILYFKFVIDIKYYEVEFKERNHVKMVIEVLQKLTFNWEPPPENFQNIRVRNSEKTALQ